MKKRFTEEQIIGFLKEADAGLPETDLFRSQEELIAAACAFQGTRIAHADEDAAAGRGR